MDEQHTVGFRDGRDAMMSLPRPIRLFAAVVTSLAGLLAVPAAPAARALPAPEATTVPEWSPHASPMLTLGLAGRVYRMPEVALPYLGHGLDPSLFLVQRPNLDRLPVRVTFAGSRIPRFPGVTLESVSAGAARGYMTAASLRALTTALARQFATDHARGSYGRDGIFAGGIALSAAISENRPLPRARFPMYTLTVRGTDLAGRPDSGDVAMVFNVDNDIDLPNVGFFYHGSVRFSLPAGHYWAIGDFPEVSSAGLITAEHLDVLPQFTVAGDTAISLDERAADSRIEMRTPRQAVVAGTVIDLHRVTAAGQLTYGIWQAGGTNPLWISPTRTRPSTGLLESFTSQWLTSPARTARPYAYALTYASAGIIPPQDHVVHAADLATIHAGIYSAIRSQGLAAALGEFRPQLTDELESPIFPVSLPGALTEYLTGNPSVTWRTTSAVLEPTVYGMVSVSGLQCGSRSYRPGQSVNEAYGTYPLHMGATAPGGCSATMTGLVPSASREGGTLRLDVPAFSDSSGHTGMGFDDQDGTRFTGALRDRQQRPAGRGRQLHLRSRPAAGAGMGTGELLGGSPGSPAVADQVRGGHHQNAGPAPALDGAARGLELAVHTGQRSPARRLDLRCHSANPCQNLLGAADDGAWLSRPG
jgi:hypothetical protein